MYEYKLDIAGTEYGMADIQSAKIEQALLGGDDSPIGNTCNAKMDVILWQKSQIPRMARIVAYCRVIGTSDWTQLGVFYISTRKIVGDRLEIVAYDGMLKSEVEWIPDQSLEFPMTMEQASAEIARLMGMTLDPRCAFNPAYTVDYPANGYVLRDVLRFIANAHVGNWVVTAKEQLLLIPRFGVLPPETFYLVTESGSPIELGGRRLRV